ncbi:MAG: site-2 protease family protein [Thermoplasmata archaeon]|jgi:membrane-associated protease RseP (regulator of RpoE activity)|nr:site-2 protease family protein [Thermoplasmata archaeon]
MNGYLVALVVFVSWIVGLYLLHRAKWLERHGMNMYGPFLMWKTQRGKELIERAAARTRIWNLYGKVSLWVCAAAMFLIMLLLLWEATIVSKVAEPPSPELILGLPGINPVIPLWYGILGLAVAIIVHELAHGVMSRMAGVKVNSLGLLFLVFPMGAFVEPDEEETKRASRSKRAKIFAAGPASNMILAMVVLGMFTGMLSTLEPVHEGALAVGVVEDSPANMAGLEPRSVVVSVGGMAIASVDDLEEREAPDPGALVSLQYYYGGELRTLDDVVDGVVVAFVTDGYAGDEYGLEPGMVLVELNGTAIGSVDSLSSALASTSAGQDVSIVVMSYDEGNGTFEVDPSVTHMVLSDRYEFYEEYYPGDNEDSNMGKGSIGAGFLALGLYAYDADYYSNALAHPFADDSGMSDFSRSWLRLIALPFLDLAPVRSPITDIYTTGGALDWMPESAFWVVANSLYWIFWLNLMVGLTNVLPAVPLDGGYIFRDGADYLFSKLLPKSTKEQREKAVGNLILFLSLFVLALIVWQLIGPRF